MKKRILLALLVVVLAFSAMLTIAACEEPQKVVITFDALDGSTPVEVEATVGKTVALPTEPTSKYGTFSGWFIDSECKTEFDPATKITEAKTLYADWTGRNRMNIIFYFNYDGANPSTTTVASYKGFPIVFPSAPEREGFDFEGWAVDKEGSSLYSENSIVMSAIKLYAKWAVAHEHTYVFSYNVAATCTSQGYDVYACSVCGITEKRNYIEALGHEYPDAGDDYFSLVKCAHDGCSSCIRKDSLNTYEDVFKYVFTADDKTAIDTLFETITTMISNASTYTVASANADYADKTSTYYLGLKQAEDDFEIQYDNFYDKLMFVVDQYKYSYVEYCADTVAAKDNYEFISEYRTECVKNFYSLYALIHETSLRDFFFSEEDGWTPEDIEKALEMSETYGDEFKELNDQSNDILIEYRKLDLSGADSAKVNKLYEQFVGINKQMAELLGYKKADGKSYVDYAYENEYNRDYSPADVASMRDYVKNYLGAYVKKVYNAYTDLQKGLNTANTGKLSVIQSSSVFTDYTATDSIKQYETEMGVFDVLNELFKNGNYVLGSGSDAKGSAFSYYIHSAKTSILYFGPGYSDSFTFIHEFGHYYNSIYNGSADLSYDLDEIHSQGNEMMYLAYCTKQNPDMTSVYKTLAAQQLYSTLATIVMSTAVDEFEQTVYCGEYTADDYETLFSDILRKYSVNGFLSDKYWKYVCIESPCYYISYAMSALPSIELYINAMSDFAATKESYLKLIRFTDVEGYAHTDSEGDIVADANFLEVLDYAGLTSPFDSSLYTKIKSYLDTRFSLS